MSPKTTNVKIASIRPDDSGFDVVVKVIENKLADHKKQITEWLVGDETGTIILTLKHDQGGSDSLASGSYIMLKNAKIEMHKGNMRLAMSPSSELEKASAINFEPKIDYNMSLVEYELVPVPKHCV